MALIHQASIRGSPKEIQKDTPHAYRIGLAIPEDLLFEILCSFDSF